jgi:hypothetical protein
MSIEDSAEKASLKALFTGPTKKYSSTQITKTAPTAIPIIVLFFSFNHALPHHISHPDMYILEAFYSISRQNHKINSLKQSCLYNYLINKKLFIRINYNGGA